MRTRKFLICISLVVVVSLTLRQVKRTWKTNLPGSKRYAITSTKWGENVKLPSKSNYNILVWRRPNGFLAHGIPDGFVVDKCRFTYDRSILPKASAVLFHYTALDKEYMPWKHYRHRDQVFVYYNIETPNFVRNYEKRDEKIFDDHFINWTMSYKLSADVFASYIEMPAYKRWYSDELFWFYDKDVLKDGKEKVEKLLKKKTRTALWVVSNCDVVKAAKLRLQYSDELVEAGLAVDRYGKCFHNAEEFNSLPVSILESYKFYLSFENSIHCEHYITEKFWIMGLKAGRVPVVWGPSKETLDMMAPTGSYIHTEDFDSPASLAAYLKYLDRNDTAYRKYFKWRVEPDERTLAILAQHQANNDKLLCRKLQSEFQRQSYEAISSYYFDNEPTKCLQN